MRTHSQQLAAGSTIDVAAAYFFLSLLGAAVPGIQQGFLLRLFALPGEWLFGAFSYFGFYLPIYLAYNGTAVLRGKDSRVGLLLSSFAAIPVIAASVAVRALIDPMFAYSPVGLGMLPLFGLMGTVVFSGTVSLIGFILLARYALVSAIPEAEAVEDLPEEPDEPESFEHPALLLPRDTVPEDQRLPEDPVQQILRANMPEFADRVYDTEDFSADLEVQVEINESREAEQVEDDSLDGLIADIEADVRAQLKADSEEIIVEDEPEIALGFESVERNLPMFDDDFEDIEEDVEEEIIHLDFSRERPKAIADDGMEAKPNAVVDLEPQDYFPADDESEDTEEEHALGQQSSDDENYAEDFDDDDLPVNEDMLPHAEPAEELNFSRKSGPYEIPVDGVLQEQSREAYWIVDSETQNQSEILRNTLQQFGIEAEVTGIRKGPVITMFEILPAPGVKLARIVNLADNIALSLAAASVRIVAPIPGKHAVGIEVPNKHRHLVTFSEILKEDEFSDKQLGIPVALGKDITGEAQIVDLAKTPHLLIAGATGAGKSVCVNSIITSVLYSRDPDEVKMMLIDPKIVELKFYNDIPHLLTPVITDPKRAFQALQWCLFEMERRYSLLDAMAVRDIRSYNKKIVDKRIATTKLPYIVVVVDEFADLMATSGKELESTLARLAAMSRAVGIHLVLATQRPSTDVITGLIKANIPSRIAFMVASKVDSRIIIDTGGAEKLLGKGDMLLTSSWDPFPKRIQGAFLSESEVEEVVKHVKVMGSPDYIDDEIFIEEDDEIITAGELDDPLMQKAIDIVCTAGKASASYLQRRLSIGYNRAARLIEEMEDMGIVGPANGSKAREILRNKDVM